jgi:L-aspartate oxidase
VTADDFISAPAVVVGGGIAGLVTALALDGCVVVSGGPIGDGASRLAQGGIAAAIGADDAPALHAADTLAVSAGLAAADVAALVTAAAPERVDWLRGMGVGFDLGANGKPALGREAGHRRHRIVHAGGDRTGAAVMQALGAAVRRRPDIRLGEGFSLVDIVTAGPRAAGVLLEGSDGTLLAVLAPHVVLATGGVGACFERTTNPASSQGAGLAAAARRGVRLADLEFMQFHPTALAVAGDPQPLLTEALRGAGAVLLDDGGRRFMPAIHPDAELAPRDVIARSVAARALAGRPVFLDATGIASRSRLQPRPTSTWVASRPTPTARRHWPGSGPAAKWPRRACTAVTGWQATRCSKAWSSASASHAPCARPRCRRRTERSRWRTARGCPPANPRASRRCVNSSARASDPCAMARP